MEDTKANIVYFPHTFVGKPQRNVLLGKEFTQNSINGGFKTTKDLGLGENFIGGNCIKLGLISEYGFYACPDRQKGIILAFHVQDPQTLTDLGKETLQKLYPDKKIVYDAYHPVTEKEDPEERRRIIENFTKAGGNPTMVRTVSAKTILALITVLESGMSENAMAEPEGVAFAPVAKDNDVEVKSSGKGKPSKQAVDGFVAEATRQRRSQARS